MFKVYLAGPISITTWKGATEWREHAIEYLAKYSIAGINPLRGKDYLKAVVGRKKFENAFDKSEGVYKGCTDINIHPLSTAHGITKRDRWDVMRSDLVLVNLMGTKQVSIGTVMEIAWADAAGKYILIAMENDNIHQHGMVIQSASLIMPTYEKALELVPVILAGITPQEVECGTEES